MMKPVFCQRCKGILFVEIKPEVIDLGLKKLNSENTYKVRHTGKYWHKICFYRMAYDNGWLNYERGDN